MKPYFQDEWVTIYHGDCREILPMLDVTPDLVLTDPPYNVGLDYCDGDKRSDYEEWSRGWFGLCPRPLVFTCGTPNLPMWCQIEPPTWTCAWAKPNVMGAPATIAYLTTWEPVLVYGRPIKRAGRDSWVQSIS